MNGRLVRVILGALALVILTAWLYGIGLAFTFTAVAISGVCTEAFLVRRLILLSRGARFTPLQAVLTGSSIVADGVFVYLGYGIPLGLAFTCCLIVDSISLRFR